MAEKNNVTRIRANDTNEKNNSKKASPAAAETSLTRDPSTKRAKTRRNKKQSKNIITAIGGYFAGAWYELRQVRWPNRRATWTLTLAVIVFSIFFVILITLLDALFKWFFELIIA